MGIPCNGWEEGVRDAVKGGTVDGVPEQVVEPALAIEGCTVDSVPKQVVELALASGRASALGLRAQGRLRRPVQRRGRVRRCTVRSWPSAANGQGDAKG
jgi:hypothetical protein